MSHFSQFLKDRRGATIVEFTLIAPMLLLLTFAIAEFGLFFWQFNSAEKATQLGARSAATSSLVTTWVSDCGTASTSSVPIGTECRDIVGYNHAWTYTCDGASLAVNCDSVAMARIVAQMRTFFPRLLMENVIVEFSGTGLGFVGRGSPVPLVSVSLQNMQYDFIAVHLFIGWTGSIDMPPFRASITGEDLNG